MGVLSRALIAESSGFYAVWVRDAAVECFAKKDWDIVILNNAIPAVPTDAYDEESCNVACVKGVRWSVVRHASMSATDVTITAPTTRLDEARVISKEIECVGWIKSVRISTDTEASLGESAASDKADDDAFEMCIEVPQSENVEFVVARFHKKGFATLTREVLDDENNFGRLLVEQNRERHSFAQDYRSNPYDAGPAAMSANKKSNWPQNFLEDDEEWAVTPQAIARTSRGKFGKHCPFKKRHTFDTKARLLAEHMPEPLRYHWINAFIKHDQPAVEARLSETDALLRQHLPLKGCEATPDSSQFALLRSRQSKLRSALYVARFIHHIDPVPQVKRISVEMQRQALSCFYHLEMSRDPQCRAACRLILRIYRWHFCIVRYVRTYKYTGKRRGCGDSIRDFRDSSKYGDPALDGMTGEGLHLATNGRGFHCKHNRYAAVNRREKDNPTCATPINPIDDTTDTVGDTTDNVGDTAPVAPTAATS